VRIAADILYLRPVRTAAESVKARSPRHTPPKTDTENIEECIEKETKPDKKQEMTSEFFK